MTPTPTSRDPQLRPLSAEAASAASTARLATAQATLNALTQAKLRRARLLKWVGVVTALVGAGTCGYGARREHCLVVAATEQHAAIGDLSWDDIAMEGLTYDLLDRQLEAKVSACMLDLTE